MNRKISNERTLVAGAVCWSPTVAYMFVSLAKGAQDVYRMKTITRVCKTPKRSTQLARSLPALKVQSDGKMSKTR
ncbi:unnamed protein product [Macrosiphum euphorbiae]|uniref:Secreted protein n=1 Tax=Macrosiphum euphorbiae TaxID=13131 RepID=A0AAV0XCL0_9HEMI|nr:unnamed protein product [Macrosiphum euphorbiae]